MSETKPTLFKSITEDELYNKTAETFYYYLLSDIVESYAASDKEALNDALKIAETSFQKRDQIIDNILAIVQNNCEPDDTYSEFEDSLFEATEHEIY